MNINNIEHFIITRINLGIYSTHPSTLGDKNIWMNNSFIKMKKYYLPSIKYQTNKNFKTVWLVDDKTPKNFVDTLNDMAKKIDATIIFDKWLTERSWGEGNSCDGDWLEKFKALIKKEIIAITRYDYDDVLGREFIDVVQSHFIPPPICIDLRYFLSCNFTGPIFLNVLPKNRPEYCSPIVTLLEETNNFKSPYYRPHYKLGRIFPVTHYHDIVWCKMEKSLKYFVAQLKETKLEDVKGFEGIGF